MRTAISLPDDLAEDVARLARRLKTSRSRVYRAAVREYVARHDSDRVAAKLDTFIARLRPTPDAFAARAARRCLERVEW